MNIYYLVTQQVLKAVVVYCFSTQLVLLSSVGSPDCTVSYNPRLCQGQTIPGMAIIRGRKAVSTGQGQNLAM